MANSTYSDDIKTAVVQALACFDSPSVVAKAIKEDFGVDISPQAVEAYDPNKRAGRSLSKKWRELFDATRKAFLEDTSKIGISHRSVRLRKLEAQIALNEKRGNSAMVAALLEQAAKEVGDAYTNRRTLDHQSSDGSMSPKPALDASKLSTAALAEIMAAADEAPDQG